jgi:hypothetical protein
MVTNGGTRNDYRATSEAAGVAQYSQVPVAISGIRDSVAAPVATFRARCFRVNTVNDQTCNGWK